MANQDVIIPPYVPGDAFTPDWLKAAEDIQRRVNAGESVSTAERVTLLEAKERARSIAATPELRDDPATLFVNEARSPNLDGTDYLEQQRQRDCDEFNAAALKFIEKYGRVLAEAAWQIVLTRR